MDREAIQQMCQGIQKKIPEGVDILVNNAGIWYIPILNYISYHLWYIQVSVYCHVFIFVFFFGLRDWLRFVSLHFHPMFFIQSTVIVSINLPSDIITHYYIWMMMKEFFFDLAIFVLDKCVMIYPLWFCRYVWAFYHWRETIGQLGQRDRSQPHGTIPNV